MPILSVEDSYFRSKNSIKLGKKLFSLEQPKVMGIINCTPDSFFEGSRNQSMSSILKIAEKQIQEGASILDIGGYSSRPNAEHASLEEEIERTKKGIVAIKTEYPDT